MKKFLPKKPELSKKNPLSHARESRASKVMAKHLGCVARRGDEEASQRAMMMGAEREREILAGKTE